MIKKFENFMGDSQKDLKKLLSHLITVIKEFGYKENNYIDNSTWETEFYKGSEYSFCIKLKLNYKNDIDLSLVQSLTNYDNFSNIMSEYLKTIKGVKFIGEEEPVIVNLFIGTRYKYSIKNINVDKVINQITKENINLSITSNKYNL